MEEESNKSVAGRKVFFVCPSFTIENTIIERLRTMEYEVYVVSDYRNTKNLLTLHTDSICYVCPDGTLSRDGWHNFIQSLESSEGFGSVDVGVISETIPPTKEEEFKKELKLTAGYYSMLGTEATLRETVKSLDKLSAKGMRKYVRVNCMDDAKAEFYWFTKDSKMFRLKLIDISSVGLAAKLPASQANAIFVNQLISDANIILNTKQVPVTAKVTAVKSASNFLLVVLMLTMDTPKSSLDAIRGYVTDSLQDALNRQIIGATQDKFNYENSKSKA